MTLDQAIEAMTEVQNGRFVDRRPRERMLSEDGDFCLSEAGIKALHLGPSPSQELTLLTGWGELQRDFFPLTLAGDLYWADAITGTLYRHDGRSVSGSPMRLKLKTRNRGS